MRTSVPKVTILAAPYGHGPLSKAIAVADELHVRGCEIEILCDPSGYALFEDRPYASGSYSWRCPIDLDELDTDLVLSAGDVSTPLYRQRTRLAVLDSLLWLRGRWERPPSTVPDRYFAQRFFLPPTTAVLGQLGQRLQFVDAVLPAWARTVQRATDDQPRLFVYPGGLHSPILDPVAAVTYLDWVGDVLRRALDDSGEAWSTRVRIPAQLIASDAARRIADLADVEPPHPTSFPEALSGSSVAVLAPGIESVLEAVAVGLVPLLLPAFNGSHVAQLIGFRSAGLGVELAPSFSNLLADLAAPKGHLNGMTERVVARCISELGPAHAAEAAGRLVTFLRLPVSTTAADRHPLGAEGARQVAEGLLDLL